MTSNDNWQQWWRTLTETDIAKTAPKAKEYSAVDLAIMGDVLRKWTLGGEDQPDRIGQEMAVMLYLLGKVARAIGAYQEGHIPSDDTLDDIRIYAVMLKRIRDKGAWPA